MGYLVRPQTHPPPRLHRGTFGFNIKKELCGNIEAYFFGKRGMEKGGGGDFYFWIDYWQKNRVKFRKGYLGDTGAMKKKTEERAEFGQAIEKMFEKKFSAFHQDVLEELGFIALEHDIIIFQSIKFFIFYFIVGLVFTGVPVWLCSFFIESKMTLIICAIIICSAITISLVITSGINIYHKISRADLYLATLHQAILVKNRQKKDKKQK